PSPLARNPISRCAFSIRDYILCTAIVPISSSFSFHPFSSAQPSAVCFSSSPRSFPSFPTNSSHVVSFVSFSFSLLSAILLVTRASSEVALVSPPCPLPLILSVFITH
ncbi:unnamed protein product, partial [Choristocarpus tenellus]